jgi:hypothetical protein
MPQSNFVRLDDKDGSTVTTNSFIAISAFSAFQPFQTIIEFREYNGMIHLWYDAMASESLQSLAFFFCILRSVHMRYWWHNLFGILLSGDGYQQAGAVATRMLRLTS